MFPRLLGLFVLYNLGCALAQDWPQWLGPHHDGKSAGFNAPATWPSQLRPLWKVDVGEGVATPALVGNRLYVFSRQEGREITRCLDTSSGKEIWRDEYDSLGATGPASGFSGPRCSPAVAEGKVVTLGVRGILSCLDADSGKLLWRKDDFSGAWPRFFTSSSPLLTGGLCVAQLGGPGNGGILAYDLATGTEKWRWTGDAPAYASPTPLSLGGQQFVVAQTESRMLALNLTDGTVVWETPFVVQGRGYNASTPLVAGQTILYAGSGRGVTAVRLAAQPDGITAKELWTNLDNSVQFNTPVLKNDLLYALSAGNELFCIDARTGRTAWKTALSAAAPAPSPAGPPGGAQGPRGGGRGGRGGGGGGFGSVVDAGSVLLALTPEAELVVFEPGAAAYKPLARIKVADSATHALPVPSGNRLFIKDANSVILWQVGD